MASSVILKAMVCYYSDLGLSRSWPPLYKPIRFLCSLSPPTRAASAPPADSLVVPQEVVVLLFPVHDVLGAPLVELQLPLLLHLGNVLCKKSQFLFYLQILHCIRLNKRDSAFSEDSFCWVLLGEALFCRNKVTCFSCMEWFFMVPTGGNIGNC